MCFASRGQSVLGQPPAVGTAPVRSPKLHVDLPMYSSLLHWCRSFFRQLTASHAPLIEPRHYWRVFLVDEIEQVQRGLRSRDVRRKPVSHV